MGFGFKKEATVAQRKDAFFKWVSLGNCEGRVGFPIMVSPFMPKLKVVQHVGRKGQINYELWALNSGNMTAQPYHIDRLALDLQKCSDFMQSPWRLDTKAAYEFARDIIRRLYNYKIKSGEIEVYSFRWNKTPKLWDFEAPILADRSDKVENYAYYRLNFSPQPFMETPTWDAFCARLSNPDVVKLFIAMLFSHNMSRTQYLWLSGPGGAGKSSLAEDFLAPLLGEAYTAVTSINYKGNHFNSLIERASLVVVNEAKPDWPMSDQFKTLTGDSKQTITEKFEKAYTAEIFCRFLFLSNDPPLLSNKPEDRRRVLFSEIAPLAPGARRNAKDIRKAYAEEAPGIIGKCLVMLLDPKNLDGDMVKSEIDNVTEIGNEYDMEIEAWINETLIITGSDDDKIASSVFIKHDSLTIWKKLRRWIELNPESGLKIKQDNGKAPPPRTTWLVGALIKPTATPRRSRF